MSAPSPQTAPLHVALAPAGRRDELLADPNVLALVGFGEATAADPADPRALTVGLPQLLGAPQFEVWRCHEPVTCGRDGEFAIAHTGEVLFAHLLVDETRFASLEAATAHAYREVLALLARRGFPHLVRIWNYFPAITERAAGIERYHAFCLGRHAVLEPIPEFERDLPAATAIGTASPGLLVYFIAARRPGRQVENPRQVSAFRYPERYSPRSPSFSRATLKHWGAARHLYVSGTASIVGHESLHAEDPRAQLDEILRNLEALIGAADAVDALGIASPREFSLLKVYVRDAEQAATLAQHLATRLPAPPPTLYLRGDICRVELALEIEALYQDR